MMRIEYRLTGVLSYKDCAILQAEKVKNELSDLGYLVSLHGCDGTHIMSASAGPIAPPFIGVGDTEDEAASQCYDVWDLNGRPTAENRRISAVFDINSQLRRS